MPKRTDIQKILIIGAGPIIISQACEFDYSGAQACKALKEEGYEVVLVNSNPATIMTDPELARRTYIEPITPEYVAEIIAAEHPDALLPTLGGQTGLNTAIAVANQGVLEKYGVEMIGASTEAIKKAEDRDLFRQAMDRIGLRIPKSGIAVNMDEALAIADDIGFPLIIRPSFTLGGTGGGVAYNAEELEIIARGGLDASLNTQVMIEESVLGWKEYELEVMRDKNDNVSIICSIENIDAMGIHTGDSITVAPAQTLTDKEYQVLRDGSIAIMREIGVDTGGSNVQFAVNPQNGEVVVVEMNPRVSRSSALASKATGYPIAKIAAKLAVGYTLDEIPNDITGKTFAAFEPTLDYCVVKIPRWAFEKFPEADDTLTTTMKSVGETMAIGRTFKEAYLKGIRSLEIGRLGIGGDGKDPDPPPDEQTLKHLLATPNSQRLFYVGMALQQGMRIDDLHGLTKIDPWFLDQMRQIVALADRLSRLGGPLEPVLLKTAKTTGFSDRQIAVLCGTTETAVKKIRDEQGVKPVYKLVDTCAAEFEAATPYYYSTYETECEARLGDHTKVMILGGGPNRIGQGIEFDYCCVHASFALKDLGIESIMVNSNPETVSTDYDTSDKLYFEPLTHEDVLNIVEKEQPKGLIVQFGGQTPLNLAMGLKAAGVPILGTQPEAIWQAEDRKQFQTLLQKLQLQQPANGTALSLEEAVQCADTIGYPVVVRPSFVLGGRAMKIVYNEADLVNFTRIAMADFGEHPVLIDHFLEDAFEVDVDAICDGETTIIGGIMEHIEEAGIHSGDSACVLPPIRFSDEMLGQISSATKAMATELNVIGLMNVQYAIRDEQLYVLEVNPRASRTIPFVSKATGVPLARLATRVMLGATLNHLGLTREVIPTHISVKEAVLPFDRFDGVDTLLGPEMKSTGEVMGIAENFGTAYAKAQQGAGQKIPTSGTVFISVRDLDKENMLPVAQSYADLGFTIIATDGTCLFLKRQGISCGRINKVAVGRPHVVDAIKNGQIQMIVNTATGDQTRKDGFRIRRAAIKYSVPYTTTLAGAMSMSRAISALKKEAIAVKALQDYSASRRPDGC